MTKHESIRYIGLFAFLIAAYCLFATLSCWLPDKTVKAHIRSASSHFAEQGCYPTSIFALKACRQDRFTESLILNEIHCVNRERPFHSAMYNGFIMYSFDQPSDLWKITHEDNLLEPAPYARYWFGSAFLYRILLSFLNFEQLQWLLFAVSCILILLFGTCYLPRAGIWKTAAMMMGWVTVYGFMMWFSLQFTPVFIISIAASILIVRFYGDNRKISMLFFIIGSLTCFFDLLTLPLLTFGWPLLTWLSLHGSEPVKAKEFGQMVKWGVLWVGCFALTWFTKWLLATLMLDYNVIQDGLKTVLYRSGNDQDASRWDAIHQNISMVPWKMFCFTLIAFVICAAIRFKTPRWQNILLYLVVAAAPYLWYAVLSNHSHIHFWFTYRLQFLTFAALLLAICDCMISEKTVYIKGA